MLIFLGVENFAKIEHAKICINSYTLFVGPNNSGKTYLMQLIQGVNERLTELVDEEILKILKHGENQNSNARSYIISQDNILQFVEYLNTKLDEKKEEIVREIFGRNVPIKKLYIEILLDMGEVYEVIQLNKKDKMGKKDSIDSLINKKRLLKYLDAIPNNILMKYSLKQVDGEVISLFASSAENKRQLLALHSILRRHSLFLPASRTGLMLLYRDFFANRVDEIMLYQVKSEEEIVPKSNQSNLTQPAYQFLRFLQTYSENQSRMKKYKTEIDFFEEKLIEGHIDTNNHTGFSYDSNTDHVSVPMYMASSMVNEIAPFVLALTSKDVYDGFIIDEIEASLHPKKQLELVRFLNRLNNKGIKLILSTHSDTFASKVNNLYILSNYVKEHKKDDMIQKLGLEKEDLVSPEQLFVYEFINLPNGKSVVKEIAGDSQTGFQFDLFTESTMHLYQEALEIGELLQDD
ncbi:AAA family ATPase [Lachnospiraceae bacterium WCA-9-b2]|jgi:predicted ATPase|uniref:AAA family ATPase n=1 Tax=Sporofaciens musculi TaxID=2681861 RepID=A0A7X3MLE2_9FIRM|nr:AAA family ATPase [Sporofaciens musculi]MXP78495.1 AAA family ATPase [Sporofaciens musculi]